MSATDIAHEKSTVRDHFSNELAGSTVAFDTIAQSVQRDPSPIDDEGLSRSSYQDVAHFIPTLQQVTSQIKNTPSKAFGN